LIVKIESRGQRWLITLQTKHGELEEAIGMRVPKPEEAYVGWSELTREYAENLPDEYASGSYHAYPSELKR